MVKKIRTRNRRTHPQDKVEGPTSQVQKLTLQDRLTRAQQQKKEEAKGTKLTAKDLQKTLDTYQKTRRTRNPRKGGVTRNRRPNSIVRSGKRPPLKDFYDKPSDYLKDAKLAPVPSWFKSDKSVDVSIIVPLYNSQAEIADQIRSWDLDRQGLSQEIVYVSDDSPDDSVQKIIDTWELRRQELARPIEGIGKIVVRGHNHGFAAACNTGAHYSRGKFLIFLNADCTMTPGWLKPIVDRLKSDDEIGLVGNLQIRNRKIDSAGSEWSWKTKSFLHIGRNSYNGKEHDPFFVDNAPSDIFLPQEREMITACCCALRREVFFDLEGFDIAYRKGYWEDADLCMRVRANGYKIFYEPQSQIYHKLGHSKAGRHPYYENNVALFESRWIHSGRLDTMVKAKRSCPPSPSIKKHANGKVYGCVIACNEEEFLEVSVDSVSSIVDEWIFVIGGNEYAQRSGMCDIKGYPTDNTLEIARKLANKYGGKVIEPPGRVWKDKVEMRNAYAQFLNPGNWMFLLDGDEVYKPDKLWRVTELMKSYDVLIMQFWLFWNYMDIIGTGKWGSYPQERVVRWKEGFKYHGTNHLHVSTSQNKLVKQALPCWKGSEKMFYHYSWVRPLTKIRQKLLYYKYQSGNNNDAYVDNVFLKWRENSKNVSSTHPMGGGGWTKFPGVHPPSVQKLIEEDKLDFALEGKWEKE
jgi:GT2 family glycosyltransferase